MSRTKHVRPPRTRGNPHTSPKKPDSGRRWQRRYRRRHDIQPHRDEKRALPTGDE